MFIPTAVITYALICLPLASPFGSTFGNSFRITTYGESHGRSVGVIVDGVPPRLVVKIEDIQSELDRRRPGQSRITTPRNEGDKVSIESGVTEDGVCLGTPICMRVEVRGAVQVSFKIEFCQNSQNCVLCRVCHVVSPSLGSFYLCHILLIVSSFCTSQNTDHRSTDYLSSDMSTAYRPSHADATYDAKYGVRAVAGGGRSSARETIGRVAGGAVAKKILSKWSGVEILAFVSKVQDIKLEEKDLDIDAFTVDDVDANIVRCPHEETATKMIERIDEIRKTGNSIGGVVTCVAR